MAHTMNTDEVKRVAHLARLTLSEVETEQYTNCLGNILHLFDALDNIETGDIYHLDLKHRTTPEAIRVDEVSEPNHREAIATFCDHFNPHSGHIIVPQVIEEA